MPIIENELNQVGAIIYPCCPADQEVGHADGCPNEGMNPRITCASSFVENKLDNGGFGE